ncbi:LINE-1 reverse transcriptase-like [Vitis vinifera]|uniref:LINE-1 reverse transcriptase-like n=1 Tax=Vitis vinifera TaxID=29760 RepID=A0A438F1G3_VITVI|nr:LINE-1 reverse transcriptase-like [Vitis vinifera]
MTKFFSQEPQQYFLVLIPKKSGAEDLRDFRPISLLGGLYKLLAKVLANRLKKVVVIDTWQKQKEKGIICKLDIEKAYDNINWKFLVKVLHKMGFGSKWVGWMWSCLSSAKFSVLVNGVPAGFFPSTKGLRQGDPLSPYLFIMGMEVLDVLIRRAVEGGFLSGCNIRGGSGPSLNISHLFFADDTMVFCLRINLAKSEIIPVGEVAEVEELAVELGCRVGTLPSQYLGLPLGAPNRAPYIWDGVEERVRRRLALWKQQYISKGGRVTLIKRGNMERKVHLVKWEVVCTDKDKGGLGLRKLALLNKALLGKWIWRYAGEKNILWRQVIKVKYGQEGLDWRPKKGNGMIGVGMCGAPDSSLAQRFPHLFGMAAHKSLTVEEMWDQNSGQGNWNLHFLRDFNDWEIELVGEFLHILRGCKPSLEEDSVIWRKGRSGQFRVKEAYRLLTNSDVMGFPYKSIWVARVPTKAAFFAWEASWGKVLTLDSLQRRGFSTSKSVFLVRMRRRKCKSYSIYCTVVRALWDIVFGLVDVKWVSPGTVKEVLASWRGSWVGKKRKKIWMSFRCVFFGRYGRRGID